MRAWVIAVMALVAPPLVLAESARADAPADRQGYEIVGADVAGLYRPDRLYVAASAGETEARSFVRVEIAPGSGSLTVTLVEVADPSAVVTPATLPAAIVACPLTSPFEPGRQPEHAEPPTEDCTVSVAGVRDGGRWAFDLTPFAARWASGTPNHGVVLRSDPTVTGATFRIVFDPAATAADIGPATDPPAEDPAGPPPPVLVPDTPAKLPTHLPDSEVGAVVPPADAPAGAASTPLPSSPAASPPRSLGTSSAIDPPDATRIAQVWLVVLPATAALAAWAIPPRTWRRRFRPGGLDD